MEHTERFICEKCDFFRENRLKYQKTRATLFQIIYLTKDTYKLFFSAVERKKIDQLKIDRLFLRNKESVPA